MDLNQRKEQFSRAFVHAIASLAGYTIYKPEVDDDSVDLGIAARGDLDTWHSPRLEMQLKCTAVGIVNRHVIPFRLKRKNYDDLRRHCWTPRILVVVLVPQRLRDWIEETESYLRLNCRAYWVSLLDQPERGREQQLTVAVPRQQVLSTHSLQGMMKRINERGQL